MTTVTVRTGYDTQAMSGANASREFPSAKKLNLQSGARYVYLYMKNPVPRGATVVSAFLDVYAAGASTGTRVLGIKKLAFSWKVNLLNWNNKPSGFGTTSTVTVGALADMSRIRFDVTDFIQDTAGGADHFGWRIESDAAAAHLLYSFDATQGHPVLTVTYIVKPSTPTNLEPAGRIGVPRWVAKFQYGDLDGDDLTSVQVQVDPAGNGTTPAFDSGEVASAVPQLNLATTAMTALADDGTTQWRARVKDAGGLWSSWSDWATVTYDAKGAVAITNPAAAPNDTVWESTPPWSWTFTGETQTAYQVRITLADRTTIVYDSTKRLGTETTHTSPEKNKSGKRILQDDVRYSLNVRAWGKKDRVGSVGDPTYSEAWRDFTLDTQTSVAAPTNVTVIQEGGTPAVLVSFQRPTSPDSFAIYRDGVRVDAGLVPADLFVSGTTYRYRDWTASPHRKHTYTVRAVVNGVTSPSSAAGTITPQVEGLWIVDPDRGLWFVVHGTAVDDWRFTEQGADYEPVGASIPFHIRQAMGTKRGSFIGKMGDDDFRSVFAMEDDLWRIAEESDLELRMVEDYQNIPVKVAELSSTTHPDSMPGYPRRQVFFRYWQTGDLPFTPKA